MSVYFIQAGESGPIKIGRAKEPRRRLYNFQTASSEQLYLLGITEKYDEFDLHIKFSHLRIRGEWFESDDELLTFINTVAQPMPTTDNDVEIDLSHLPRVQSETISLEARVKKVTKVDDFCKRAGIAKTTWQRWKNGSIEYPNMRRWLKVHEVLNELEAKQ